MEIGNFFSWELATTVAGAAAMVYVLLSVFREILVLCYVGPKTPLLEKIAAYVISLGIITIVISQGESPTWADYTLGVLNAGVVALAVEKVKEVKDRLYVKQFTKIYARESKED